MMLKQQQDYFLKSQGRTIRQHLRLGTTRARVTAPIEPANQAELMVDYILAEQGGV